MTSRLSKIVLGFALAAATGTPQVVTPGRGSRLYIRSITIVRPMTPDGAPDMADRIYKALAKVPLLTDSKVDEGGLLGAIDKAEKAIERIYESAGRSVRVEHEVAQVPPRSSIEVRFRVIETSRAR